MSAGPPGLPSAALFDLDGTLIDSEQMMSAAIAQVLSDAGSPLSADDARRLGIGRSWVDVHSSLEVRERTGWTVSEMVERAVEHVVISGSQPRILTGAVALIESLAERGVLVGIVSGSLRREVDAAVGRLGIARHLALAHGAEDYPRGKPDPSGYLGAARLLEVEPRSCVVFEDSEVGVASALSAGMSVVATIEAAVPRGTPGHQDVSRAHLVVETLAEVTPSALAEVMSLGDLSG